jgi:hypothetical protein
MLFEHGKKQYGSNYQYYDGKYAKTFKKFREIIIHDLLFEHVLFWIAFT